MSVARTHERMSAVELFAGAGGAALGLHAAGVAHLACVERDPCAAATLRAAGLPAVEADVLAWLRSGPDLSPDLLWASPPCQPYSAAGKKLGSDDPRDGWPLVLLAFEVLRPRWVAIENVARAPARAWAEQLREAGYTCVSHRILDAADYGVPQHRRRVFLVAGPQPIRWPAPTHCDPCDTLLISGLLRPWVSCRDALGDLVALEPGAGGHGAAPRDGSRPSHTITASQPMYMRAAHPELLDRPAPTVTTTEVKGTRASAASGYRLKNAPDRASDMAFLATGRRRLTVGECARLQAFPDGHPWQGTKEAIYRQIGNAVPPIMAEVVARAIVEAER